MRMRITISVSELLFDIYNKSRGEMLSAVPDQEARYHLEAGSDSQEELCRLINTSLSSVHVLLQRFTRSAPALELIGCNAQDVDPDTTIEIRLNDNYRRAADQIQSVTQLLHSYLVNTVLSKFYSTRGGGADGVSGVADKMAQVRLQEAAANLTSIQNYFYDKLRPERSVPDNSDTL